MLMPDFRLVLVVLVIILMMDLEVVSVDIVADLEDMVVVLVDMAVVLVDLVIMDKISMIFGLYVINLCIMYIVHNKNKCIFCN